MKDKILKLLLKIPEGKVTTYKELAEAAGSYPRAVGKVLNSNKETGKYPCYRVVRSDGSVGSYNRGKEEKKRLLERDGIEVKRGRVNLEDRLFKFS